MKDKIVSDEKLLGELISRRPGWQEMLKKVLQGEAIWYQIEI